MSEAVLLFGGTANLKFKLTKKCLTFMIFVDNSVMNKTKRRFCICKYQLVKVDHVHES